MTVTTDAPTSQAEPENNDSTISGAIRAYFDRLRGGEVGSLPAVLGLIALVIFFSVAKPDSFATKGNFANLFAQAAPVIFIAMGLVFILLLGEIDLGAGFTAGATAAILATLMTNHGIVWPVAVLASVLTGVVIGLVLGLLVARLNIPSFVVTLASFLALQGVLLLVIGSAGTISVSNDVILSIMNNNMSPLVSWLFFVVIVAGFAGVGLFSAAGRRRAGLPAAAPAVLGAKVLALAIILGVVTFFLNLERSAHPFIKSIKGVPIIIPFTLVFLLILTFLLNRTSYGRHVYAVGGNTEAARRAGINVSFIKISCFVIGSTMAAVAGILFASYNNSVAPTTGGASNLLYAVGAAVIGGTSLFGGKGRVIDAILGGLVIGVVQNGLLLLTSKSGTQYIVTGIVLLLAASVDAISRRRTAATGR
jgi:D-xylose transport system permease protein